ncbi:hypothetical protein C1645_814617 [Glomus cerebriforme]|uniref:Uncharacterized protein n=1 Tax=Glomus cerebriforme TaxID=658196 RepID=A0A397TPK6_9GLOM|nr:hypothetical protein C1645_814617 [Glomus cerebriforme]
MKITLMTKFVGITARTAINPQFTKIALINLIQAQTGSPFPQGGTPLIYAFTFNNRQDC